MNCFQRKDTFLVEIISCSLLSCFSVSNLFLLLKQFICIFCFLKKNFKVKILILFYEDIKKPLCFHICIYIYAPWGWRAELVRPLRELTAFPEDLASVSSFNLAAHSLSLPVPEDPLPSSGLCEHQMCRWLHIHTRIHLKDNFKNLLGWQYCSVGKGVCFPSLLTWVWSLELI